MAGPGGTIRVDGFRGGKLPPKSQIRSIRFASGMFAAENHGGGMMFVDIITQPGIGPLRGGVDFPFRDDALNARNAFQQEKGPEQTQQTTFNMSRNAAARIRRRSRCRSAAHRSTTRPTSSPRRSGWDANARRSGGRPIASTSTAGSITALTKSHTLRATFQQNGNDQRNLGVGALRSARPRLRADGDRRACCGWRRAVRGGRTSFGEMRLQVRWSETDVVVGNRSPDRAGARRLHVGRRAAGRRPSRHRARMGDQHRLRAGPARDAVRRAGRGRLVYDSDNRTNYLGTFTFASLERLRRRTAVELHPAARQSARRVLARGRPASSSRTTGAPARISRSAPACARSSRPTSTTRLNLAPRAGLTWSPFKNGKTTVRAGGGIFYDWLEAEVYEQTLRVDGVRQQDLHRP